VAANEGGLCFCAVVAVGEPVEPPDAETWSFLLPVLKNNSGTNLLPVQRSGAGCWQHLLQLIDL
jgi:hypothetical protein